MKKVSAALAIAMIFAMMLSILPASGCSGDEPEDYRYGVVFIESKFGTGSGFAIGTPGEPVEYIVTCAHVVEAVLEGQLYYVNNVTVYFNAATNDYTLAEVVFRDSEKDVAILKLVEPTTKRNAFKLRVLDSKNYDYNEDFTALGFPGYNVRISDSFYGGIDDMVTTTGKIATINTIDGVKSLQLDFTISTGNSGGPVVDKDGNVVGIVYLRYTDAVTTIDFVNYAISIDELIDLASQTKYGYIVEDKTTDSNTMLIIIVCSAAGALALALVLVLLLRRSRKPAAEPAAAAAAAAAPVAPFERIGGGYGDIQPTSVVNTPSTPAYQSSRSVVCVSGSLAGRTFIVAGTTRIGRDSNQCQIYFPPAEPGISRTHCTIELSGGDMRVTDTSSTGTYLNGSRIPYGVSVSVPVGSRIQLGAPDRTVFEVR